MPLSDIFNKLKTSIVGTSTLGIDAKLDNAVKDITAYRSQIGRNGYIELVKNLIAKTGLEVPMSLSQSTMLTPAALGQGTRLTRYRSYDGIVSNINYAHRAITVLTDNILAPDDITKTTLEVAPVTYLASEKNISSDVRNCKDLIKKLKIENALEIIVKGTLTYGDFFAEIADAKTALTSRSAILTEAHRLDPKIKDSFIVEGEDQKKHEIILDYSSFEDTKKSENDQKSGIELQDIHILYYEPKRVVKLQSDMFPVCFGYLVFPQAVINPSLTIQNQMVNSICQNILASLAKKIPDLDKDTINTGDLKDIIYTMMKESDPSRAMSIRYVSPSRMQHFMIPSTKYYPYGESILDSTVFTAKLITALETALVIFRLNRSTEKRKISIEVGLPRDARKAIEKIKEEFRKRKVSIDSLGTVDTIPGMINTFEDIYLPAKDGKNFVDVTTFAEGLVDTRGKVDEIKTLRDQMVASLGVPPSFIGIEENMNAKATLAEENTMFARTIVNNQKYFTQQIKDLIQKVYEILDPEKALSIMDNVLISLPPPKSLQFEREAKYMSDLANLIQTLEGIGVPKEWAKKKYLTNIDWDEVKKFEIDNKIDKNLGIKKRADAGMEMGGGVGGGFPPMGGGGEMGY